MDHGSEYTSHEFSILVSSKGIIPMYVTVGSSRASEVAERLNLTLINNCRTLLRRRGLSHAVVTCCKICSDHVERYLQQFSGNFTQRQGWTQSLNASTVLPFRQLLIVNIPRARNKLEFCVETAYALDPSDKSHGFIVYVPKKNVIVDTTASQLQMNCSATAKRTSRTNLNFQKFFA